MTPTGCPVSAGAAAFDAFEGPYQVDPAEALRWSREQEPVFYSPKLGYWVVSRYEHVKAIFRDNITFSPANVLEKVTPNAPEANAVLARYKYGMDRTLVNEDEPAHMERRRSLMHSFVPEELAHHEPMVRRLTREYVDRFIDKGEADLVDEMLWEIPLTVALHFLGVPEEDMDTLRKYSIAHTVNTWGRPTHDEQLAVAEAVGKFWQYAGQGARKDARRSVRAWLDGVCDPPPGRAAGRHHGFLPALDDDGRDRGGARDDGERGGECPAAFAAATRRVGRALQRPVAHSECRRGVPAPVRLHRRVAEACNRRHARVGDVDLPKGAKLLIVMASANHDPRHFENADDLDIYRDNTTDHLSFGYGSHQCMGKNLARMEMRIFLEEFTKRLPHMELVPGQAFDLPAEHVVPGSGPPPGALGPRQQPGAPRCRPA